MDTLQGHLVVAAPHQFDPNFAQTAALVVQHTGRGALGLIVNRRARQNPASTDSGPPSTGGSSAGAGPASAAP